MSTKRYQKQDQLSHVLLRPDMYIGSTKLRKIEEYIAEKKEDNEYKIYQKEINSSPGILRIFIEALSNAIDNVERSKNTDTPCTTIKVSINEETGETSIWNDGDVVPIEMHEDERVYNHTLIFGQLLTGSNYDDEEERIIAGKNGIGGKALNIFSSTFTVSGCDPKNKKTFSQTWTNNMRDVGEPVIKNSKAKDKGYTQVTWIPDFSQFQLKKYTSDIIALYTKNVLDAAMLSKIKVYLNDNLVNVKNLSQYSQLYDTPSEDKIYIKTDTSEVVLTPSSNGYEYISFVNGIYTRMGGQHVEAWAEAIFRPIVEKFNGKGKNSPKINITDVKQFFRLFVISTVIRPEFNGQNKDRLESPSVPASVKPAQITAITKWSIMDNIDEIIRSKEMMVLKKAERGKKKNIKIEGLDPANNAGGKYSKDCCLFVCEGLSAKTYVVAGINTGVYGKQGRDWFGVLPVTGKCVAPNTPILMWDSTIKLAKDIVIGDELIGDDGKKRIVDSTTSGVDQMYEIKQLNGMNYTVNSQHTLSFIFSGNGTISHKDNGSYEIKWYDKYKRKLMFKNIKYLKDSDIINPFVHKNSHGCEICSNTYANRNNLRRHYRESHPQQKYPDPQVYTAHNRSTISQTEAYDKIVEFKNTLEIEYKIDMTISEYMSFNQKKQLKGYKLDTAVEWDHQSVIIDPYILGMWLGDGDKSGWGFASDDIELVNAWKIWAEQNNAVITHKRKYYYYIRCKNKPDNRKNHEIYHPFRKQLQSYDLIGNKHVPISYIYNDKNTRLQLLAGLIDTDGHVSDDGKSIQFTQSIEHENIIDSFIYIARSLGFSCCDKKIKKVSWTHNDEKNYGEAFCVHMSGNIKEIPTILHRKKCNNHQLIKNPNHTGIQINSKGVGEYVGFSVNGNHRFLLGDFTVTHNCLNTRNAAPTSIAANKVVMSFIQTTGLRYDVDYTNEDNFKTLSYGKIILIADADCFTKDTPLLIKKDGNIDVISCETLYKSDNKNVEIWSANGWTKMKGIICKETDKKILQINTGCGLIKCTEDHKMMLENGDEIKACELKIGDRLLRTQGSLVYPLEHITNTYINTKEAFDWGLFFAEGSCEDHIMEKYYNHYQLNINGDKSVSEFITIMQERFYDVNNREYKKVPKEILNSDLDVQQSFLDGFRSLKEKKNAMSFDIFGQLGAQGLCVILERLGYCVNVNHNKRDIYTIHYSNTLYPSAIKSIKTIDYDDYVYDIETENHLLNAGIGGLVVHNCDGIHIEGLLMNLIHSLFPSLLNRKEPYISSMKTPIARVFIPKSKDLLFYDETRFNKYISEQTKKVNVKYYKGLGTTREEDVPDTFGLKMVEYINDKDVLVNMNKVFHKKHSDDRKKWLEEYIPSEKTFSLDDQDRFCNMNISNFLNDEMIKFSHADCARSIPSGIDGLKESQRKILYAVRKRNLRYSGSSLKVAQLSGYTAEHSNYHHGEQNLQDTIVNMASGFVGTNNIPLLYPDGGFGCLDPKTHVLLWDGGIIEAQYVKIGDKLIGDDGKPRVVRKTIEGNDTMYDIIQGYGDTYRVNSYHILTLCYSMHKVIYWKNSAKSWVLNYFDDITKKSYTKQIKINKILSKDEAFEKINEIANKIPDGNIFDINVQEYLSLSKSEKRYFKSVKNTVPIKWAQKEVPIDPYIFGHWLGDGDHSGVGFATPDPEIVKEWVKYTETIGAEIVHNVNGENHENYHYCIRRKGSNKGTASTFLAIGHPNHSSKTCKGCMTSKVLHPSCDWIYEDFKEGDVKCIGKNINGIERNDFQPFKEILKKHELMKNKHIPNYYIYNSEEVRLKLLAGFVDSDGTIRRNGDGVQHIEISQEIKTHGHLIDKLQYIAQSLGFRATTSIKISAVRESGKSSTIKSLFISGGDLYKIPTKVQHKKLYKIERKRNTIFCDFKVKIVGEGRFVGWDIDQNERFLLGDFTVTHNTRLEGGQDAASARYIFTKMEGMTEYIFRTEDDPLLTPVNDDGDLVQPEHYIPIVPMILINGATGIGTGWSCNVPCYNPLDVIQCLKTWIENDGEVLLEDPDNPGSIISMLPQISPWYRGFKGEIKQDGDNRFVTQGIVTQTKADVKEVTELPIGLWTNKFKEFCEDLVGEKQLKSMKNYSTTRDAHFILNETSDGIRCSIENLKIQSYVYTSNMVLFTEKNQLKKYENVDQIIDNFCKVRLDYYVKRKAYQIKNLENEIRHLGNKERFIQEVIDEDLKIMKVKEEDVISSLKQRGYDEEPNVGGYDYLLRLQVRTFTVEKVNQLKNDIKSSKTKLDNLKKTKPEKIWLSELDEFENQYEKWLVDMSKRVPKKTNGKK